MLWAGCPLAIKLKYNYEHMYRRCNPLALTSQSCNSSSVRRAWHGSARHQVLRCSECCSEQWPVWTLPEDARQAEGFVPVASAQFCPGQQLDWERAVIWEHSGACQSVLWDMLSSEPAFAAH